MKRFIGVVTVATLSTVYSSVIHAQAPVSPVTASISAGAAFPMGDLEDIGGTGFNLAGGVEFGSPMPFKIRGELAYSRFGERDATFPDGSGGSVNVNVRPSNLAITVNAILAPTVPAAQVRPYAIAGVGFYNAKVGVEVAGSGLDFSGSDSKSGIGLNGGAGVRFQFVGFSSFIEARYHHMFKGMPDTESQDESWTSAGYLPITFGITIGG